MIQSHDFRSWQTPFGTTALRGASLIAPLLAGAWLVGLGGCGGGVSGPDDRPDAASTSAGGSTGQGGSSGAAGHGGSGGFTVDGGAADAGRGGGGGNTGVGDAGECNQIVNTGAVAACTAFAGEPAASGGAIPDGIYELDSWQTMTGCPIMVRETGRFTRTGTNTYLVQGVTDTSMGQQARTTFTFTASGTTLDQMFLWGDDTNRTWNYSVLTTAAITTLRVSNSSSAFVFVLAGP